MKSRYTYIITAIFYLFFSSCSDFLDQGPESKLADDQVFLDEKTTNGFIVGLYADWRGGKSGRVNPYLGTDEGLAGGFQYMDNNDRKGIEGYGNTLNPTNGIVREFWDNRYRMVTRSAEAIGYLSINEGSKSSLFNQYLGEASFLRAAGMWELVMMFGPVVMHDMNQPDLMYARQPIEKVYKQIISDLLTAEKYVPDPSNVYDKNRISKSLVQGILGKVYLYAPEGIRDYTKAAEMFKKVIDNPYYGGKGAVSYSSIFDAFKNNSDDYNKELIYAFQYNVGSPYNNANEWDFGSRAVTQMTPKLGEAMAPWAGFDAILPTEYAYKMQTDGGVWEDGDIRRDETIRFDFEWTDLKGEKYVPNMKGWVWGDELEPHVKKYEDLRIVEKGYSTYHTGKNIPYLRFSDVVLCYGEALYFSGEQAQGINIINDIVRTRAFGGTLPADKKWSTGMDANTFMENLLDERLRELCFEGWRKLDLMRTGKVKEYVSKRNRWHRSNKWTNKFGDVKDTNGPLTIQDHKLLWPIPLDEIKQNPGLSDYDQNPGYNK